MTAAPRRDRQSSQKHDALKIVLIYILVGGLWILLSDRIVEALVSDKRTLTDVNTAKGWFFIVATGWMLYALIRSSVTALQRTEKRQTVFAKT